MILLDTNVLSELMKANPDEAVVAWVDKQPTTTLFVSVITRAEIELGVALLPEGQRKRNIQDAAKRMFEAFSDRLLVFGEIAAVQYGQLVAHRTRNGRFTSHQSYYPQSYPQPYPQPASQPLEYTLI